MPAYLIYSRLVIQLAAENNIPCTEKNISLTELYTADEVFCSGTMGELTPIKSIDGRRIRNKSRVSLLPQLIEAFEKSIPQYLINI